MPDRELPREAFEQRFRSRFIDPAFSHLRSELQAITDAAWDAYADSRKAPLTRKAGPGFADPDYDLALDWLAAREAIHAAQRRHDDPDGPARILLVNGSSRTEHTCPGEMSKTWRMIELARAAMAAPGFDIEVIDLSRTVSEFGKTIAAHALCEAVLALRSGKLIEAGAQLREPRPK